MANEEIKIEFSDEQVKSFAIRLVPIMKRYFADEQVQKEFAEWLQNKEKQEDIKNEQK